MAYIVKLLCWPINHYRCALNRWPAHPVFWVSMIFTITLMTRLAYISLQYQRSYREVTREVFQRLTNFESTSDNNVWSLWLLSGNEGFLAAHGPLTWGPDNQRLALKVWSRWFMAHVRLHVAKSPVPVRIAFDDGFNEGWDWRDTPTQLPTLVFGARVGDTNALPVPDPQYIDFRESYASALLNERDSRHASLSVPLSARIDFAVWRGALEASRERNFFDQCPAVADPSSAITADDVLPRALFVQVGGCVQVVTPRAYALCRVLYRIVSVARPRSDVQLVREQHWDCDTDGLPITESDMRRFRYQVDLDGIANSWRGFLWKSQSGSVLLKQRSTWRMWYSPRFTPGVHYVEIENTFMDFGEQLAWIRGHTKKAEDMVATIRATWIEVFGSWEPGIEATLDALEKCGWTRAAARLDN